MDETAQPRIDVMGHDGRRLTLADLPSPKTKRWVIRRKAEVVAAVRGGLLSLEDACSLYTLNTDEFQSWEFCIDHYGIKGLRTTRTQFYFTGMPRLRRLRRQRPHDLDNGWLALPMRSTQFHGPARSCIEEEPAGGVHRSARESGGVRTSNAREVIFPAPPSPQLSLHPV
jgi:Protein of unknown function (DUF1153)